MRHDNRDSLFLSRTSSPEAWTAALPGLGLLAVTQPTSLLKCLTRSAALLPHFPGPFSGPGKEFSRPSGFFGNVSVQISGDGVSTCSFRLWLPWQVVKWRCSAFTPILPPGAAVPAWLHSSLSVTLSPPVSGSRGRVISENGY